MTNAQIIFNESIELMNQGIIKGTGRTFTVEMEDGTKKTIEEPEELHTFAAWKERGRQVKKGEHAKAKFYIWKCRMSHDTIFIDSSRIFNASFLLMFIIPRPPASSSALLRFGQNGDLSFSTVLILFRNILRHYILLHRNILHLSL